MKATKDIRDAIKTVVAATGLFRDVVPYSLARLDEDVFLNDLNRLKLPCCLIFVMRDTEDGKPKERTITWGLIIAFRGVEADSGDACTDAVDALRATVLTQSLYPKVHLRPTSNMTMLESGPTHTACMLECVTVEHA